jgi:hypothetical protein
VVKDSHFTGKNISYQKDLLEFYLHIPVLKLQVPAIPFNLLLKLGFIISIVLKTTLFRPVF